MNSWLQKNLVLNPWPREVTQAAYPAQLFIALHWTKDSIWITKQEEIRSKGWSQLRDAVADVVQIR